MSIHELKYEKYRTLYASTLSKVISCYRYSCLVFTAFSPKRSALLCAISVASSLGGFCSIHTKDMLPEYANANKLKNLNYGYLLKTTNMYIN